ncbi:MAG: SDR family NAD(P)-dependent oxidoreductase, partial [Paracoccaceae bacterium]
MRDFKSKRYWLIGASEGLGAALAHELSRAGADLILSARNEEALHALAESLPGQAEVVPIDVRDMGSVERAAQAAGSLDGLVYLAGVYWPFAAQAWHVEQTIAMCDVNFTGAARVLGQVVPQFVAKDSGHIVITGSIGGFRGLPSAIGYNASKAGVMTLAESLYCDLRQSGVSVQLVNPGFIKTR